MFTMFTSGYISGYHERKAIINAVNIKISDITDVLFDTFELSRPKPFN